MTGFLMCARTFLISFGPQLSGELDRIHQIDFCDDVLTGGDCDSDFDYKGWCSSVTTRFDGDGSNDYGSNDYGSC